MWIAGDGGEGGCVPHSYSRTQDNGGSISIYAFNTTEAGKQDAMNHMQVLKASVGSDTCHFCLSFIGQSCQ